MIAKHCHSGRMPNLHLGKHITFRPQHRSYISVVGNVMNVILCPVCEEIIQCQFHSHRCCKDVVAELYPERSNDVCRMAENLLLGIQSVLSLIDFEKYQCDKGWSTCIISQLPDEFEKISSGLHYKLAFGQLLVCSFLFSDHNLKGLLERLKLKPEFGFNIPRMKRIVYVQIV